MLCTCMYMYVWYTHTCTCTLYLGSVYTYMYVLHGQDRWHGACGYTCIYHIKQALWYVCAMHKKDKLKLACPRQSQHFSDVGVVYGMGENIHTTSKQDLNRTLVNICVCVYSVEM